MNKFFATATASVIVVVLAGAASAAGTAGVTTLVAAAPSATVSSNILPSTAGVTTITTAAPSPTVPGAPTSSSGGNNKSGHRDDHGLVRGSNLTVWNNGAAMSTLAATVPGNTVIQPPNLTPVTTSVVTAPVISSVAPAPVITATTAAPIVPFTSTSAPVATSFGTTISAGVVYLPTSTD